MEPRSLPVLAAPLSVGLTRKCLACNKRFALKHQQTVEHPTLGQLKTYRCKLCSKTLAFASSIPAKVN